MTIAGRPEERDGPGPGWRKLVAHVHTSWGSPDATLRPEQAVRLAEQAGADGLVFYEHSRRWEPDELEALRRRTGTQLLLVGAVELSLGDCHLVVFGDVWPLWGPEEHPGSSETLDVATRVRQRGGASLLAHPWDARFQVSVELAKGLGVDAVEVHNARGAPAPPGVLVKTLELGLAVMAGADAHRPGHPLDRAFVWVPPPVLSERTLVMALLSRRTWVQGHLVSDGLGVEVVGG